MSARVVLPPGDDLCNHDDQHHPEGGVHAAPFHRDRAADEDAGKQSPRTTEQPLTDAAPLARRRSQVQDDGDERSHHEHGQEHVEHRDPRLDQMQDVDRQQAGCHRRAHSRQ